MTIQLNNGQIIPVLRGQFIVSAPTLLGSYDIIINQGSEYTISGQWLDVLGNLIDLTDAVSTMIVRGSFHNDSEVFYTFASTDAIPNIILGMNGFELNWDINQSAVLNIGDYWYELGVLLTGGENITIMQGWFIIH